MPVNPAISGTWTDLTNPFPGVSGFGPDTALLLNDGSVVMHEVCTSNWFRLLPDRTNSYINGNWSAYAVGDNSPISPMIGSGTVPDGYGPLFYASQVLPDGRFIVNGGEYEFSNGKGNYCNGGSGSADSTKGSLYNPQTDTWTAVPPPIGWSHIGDASSIIIGPNKITGISQPWSYMIADCCDSNPQRRQQAVATIAPIPTNTVTWTITGAGKADPNSEEGWTLLPNGQFLTVDTQDGTNSETFNPGTNLWRSAGNTPVFLGNNLGMAIVPEMGPAVMTGYGLVVQIGANPNTALFNPVTRSWTAGPTFPSKQETPDGPAALLPNGNILVQTSIGFKPPSLFWELGGETLPHPGAAILTPVANPPCGDPSLTDVGAFKGRMLVIPTGQILWDPGEGITCTSIHTPNPDDPASSGVGPDYTPWFPSISSISSKKLKRGLLKQSYLSLKYVHHSRHGPQWDLPRCHVWGRRSDGH
jgi:hypothetical protein